MACQFYIWTLNIVVSGFMVYLSYIFYLVYLIIFMFYLCGCLYSISANIRNTSVTRLRDKQMMNEAQLQSTSFRLEWLICLVCDYHSFCEWWMQFRFSDVSIQLCCLRVVLLNNFISYANCVAKNYWCFNFHGVSYKRIL